MSEYFDLDAGTRDSLIVTSPRIQAAIDMLHDHFAKFTTEDAALGFDVVPLVPAKSSRRVRPISADSGFSSMGGSPRMRSSRFRSTNSASSAASNSSDDESTGSIDTPASSVMNIRSSLRMSEKPHTSSHLPSHSHSHSHHDLHESRHTKSSSITSSSTHTSTSSRPSFEKLELDFSGIDEAIFGLITIGAQEPDSTRVHRDAAKGYKQSREQRRNARLMKHNNLQVSWI